MTNTSLIKSISAIAAATAIWLFVASTLKPAAAAEASATETEITAIANDWLVKQQQALTAAVEARLPAAFEFVGTRVVPVFVGALPQFRFVAIDAEVETGFFQ